MLAAHLRLHSKAHFRAPSSSSTRRPACQVGLCWLGYTRSSCVTPASPYAGNRRHVATRVAQRSLGAILSEIEALKGSADALEKELSAVSAVAEGAAKRSRRLAARSHELQEYALEHVMLGDEAAARAALQQKAAVADALRQATRRAETNSALARRLEEVLVLKQSRVLAMIREANRQQAAADAASAAASSGSAAGREKSAEAAGRRLKRSRSTAWSSETLHASFDGGSTTAADWTGAWTDSDSRD